MKWLRWAIPFGGAFLPLRLPKGGLRYPESVPSVSIPDARRRYRHHFFYDARNVLEIDLFVEKCGHGDLIGGVEGYGFCAPVAAAS